MKVFKGKHLFQKNENNVDEWNNSQPFTFQGEVVQWSI